LIATLAVNNGCNNGQGTFSSENKTCFDLIKKNYKIIEIDSCEYIVYSYSKGYGGYGFMSHKGNCKYCKQRKSYSR